MKTAGLRASLLALGAAASFAVAPVAQAACFTEAALAPAKLRYLDVMLMVSALRCRTGADNFQEAYYDFLTAHRAELGRANHALLADFAARMGPARAPAEMDRTSVIIANHYGQDSGVGCHELRMVTEGLAHSHEPGALQEAADALVAGAVADNACRVTLASRP
jgi:hypothetical protein